MPFEYQMKNGKEFYVFIKDLGTFKVGEEYELDSLYFDWDTFELKAYDCQGCLVKSQPLTVIERFSDE